MTASNENEVSDIAIDLLEKRLIACANVIHPRRSIYFGRKNRGQETLLLMKAERTLFNKRGPRTSEIHGYEAPEVLAIDISAGKHPHPEWWDEEDQKLAIFQRLRRT